MFGSSLHSVVCSRRAHVLFTLFVFVAYGGVQHILCCVFVLFFFVLCIYVVIFSGLSTLIAPSVFSHVFTCHNGRQCYHVQCHLCSEPQTPYHADYCQLFTSPGTSVIINAKGILSLSMPIFANLRLLSCFLCPSLGLGVSFDPPLPRQSKWNY